MVGELISSPQPAIAGLAQGSCNENGTLTADSSSSPPPSPLSPQRHQQQPPISPRKKKGLRLIKPVDDDNVKQRGQVWGDLRASMANKKGLFRGLKRNTKNRNKLFEDKKTTKTESGEKLSDTSTETSDPSTPASPTRTKATAEVSVVTSDLPPTAVDLDAVDEMMVVNNTIGSAAVFIPDEKPSVPTSLVSSPAHHHHNIHRRIKPVTEMSDDQVTTWERDFGALPDDEEAEGGSPETKDGSKRSKRRRRRDRRRRKNGVKQGGSLSPFKSSKKKIQSLDKSLSSQIEVFDHSWGDLGHLQHSFTDMQDDPIPVIKVAEEEPEEEITGIGKKIGKRDSFSNLDSFGDENGKWKDILALATMDHTLSVKDFDKSSLDNVFRDDAMAPTDDEPFGFFYGDDDAVPAIYDDGGIMSEFNRPPTTGSEDTMFKVMEQLLLDDGVEIADDTAIWEPIPVLETESESELKQSLDESKFTLDDKIGDELKQRLEVANDEAANDDDESFGTAHETEEDDISTLEEMEKPRSKRVIRFADEQGLPVATVMQTGNEHDGGPEMARVVMLLLSPKDRKFEFVHAEYQMGAKTTVQDVIDQMPTLAVDVLFRDAEFSTLFRTGKGACELVNSLPLSECKLEKGEVVIGILKGYSGKDIVQSALPLLVNPKIAKAVKHARRTGRGLKYIMTRSEFQEHKKEQEEKKFSQTSKVQSMIQRLEAKSSPGQMTDKKSIDAAVSSPRGGNSNKSSMEPAAMKSATLQRTEVSEKLDTDETLSDFSDAKSASPQPTNYSAKSATGESLPGSSDLESELLQRISSSEKFDPDESESDFSDSNSGNDIAVPDSPTNGFAVLTKPEPMKDAAKSEEDKTLDVPDIPRMDSTGLAAEQESQQKVVSMIQAGLVATFGIFYSFSRK